MLCVYIFGSYWWLFQLIVLLKPGFHFWSSFVPSWVGKVTTETWIFVSVIINLLQPVELVQVDEYVKMRLTPELINGISRVPQKLL